MKLYPTVTIPIVDTGDYETLCENCSSQTDVEHTEADCEAYRVECAALDEMMGVDIALMLGEELSGWTGLHAWVGVGDYGGRTVGAICMHCGLDANDDDAEGACAGPGGWLADRPAPLEGAAN